MTHPTGTSLDARLLSRLRTEHARTLRRAERLERSLRGVDRLGSLELHSLRSLAAQLAGPFAAHLDAEERDLFPRLERAFPELSGTLGRMLEEHGELRAMVVDLGALLARDASPARDERLFVLGTDLSELLRLHIHVEEHAVYGWFERWLRSARAGTGTARRNDPGQGKTP